MDVAAHDLTRTIDCQVVGCDQEADPGALVCRRHSEAHTRERFGEDLARATRPIGEAEPEEEHGGRKPRGYWTKERAVAAVQEVAASLGRTPNHKELSEAGYGSIVTHKALQRFGVTFVELVREAGLEPLSTRGGRRLGSGAPAGPRPTPEAAFETKARSLVAVGKRLDAAIARKKREAEKLRRQRSQLQQREVTIDQDVAAALREWRNVCQQLAG